jgi:hypothetical protein
MSNTPLPDYRSLYQSLARSGVLIPSNNRTIVTVSDATYAHDGHTFPIQVDAFALQQAECAYTNHERLSEELTQLHKPARRANQIALPIRAAQREQLVWGFSGFTFPDRPYAIEGRGMHALLACLRKAEQLPSLIVDGGGSEGVLGLSGLLAQRFAIPSLGYIPFPGLSTMGPRTHLVVHKSSFRDREVLVGLTPDVLVCVGGGPGAQRECEVAIQNGGVVLLMVLREYDYEQAVQYVYRSSKILAKASQEGRLIICTGLVDIQARVPRVIHAARRFSLPSRGRRMNTLASYLA